jgi:hypothetical protein
MYSYVKIIFKLIFLFNSVIFRKIKTKTVMNIEVFDIFCIAIPINISIL